MSEKQYHAVPSLPVWNYASAIARAVEWLGDRYLLAAPINATLAQRPSSTLDRHGKEVS
jgi:hypothetical protein